MPSDPIDPLDVLAVDALLSDEERRVRDEVRSFVRGRVLDDIEDWYLDGEFPRHLVGELGKLGVLGMHLSGYGCAGRNAVSYGLACLEVEAGDSGLRSFVSVQGSLAMYPIWRYGSDEQKQRWLPAMAAGEAVGCFALTEPGAGSNPAQMTTTARRDGSDWVLDGHKRWSTNAAIADVAIVWAQTDDGVRGFVVPTDTPGVSTPWITNKHSLRASVSSEVLLDSVRLPGDAVLPGVTGLSGPLSCLNEARFGIIWGVLGAGRACYEAALNRALEREQFGKPIAAYQLTQAKLVDMVLELDKGLLLALHLGRKKDAGTLRHEQVSHAKLNNVREVLEVARSARTILGAEGVTTNQPVMRHMANLESVLTYEGTSEVHTLALGKALTGWSAFS